MAKGRPSKLKISESELVTYLIDKLVDENGKKVSHRKLWKSDEFIQYTGMCHQKDPTKGVSDGTMNYWQSCKEFTIPILSANNNDRKYTLEETTLYNYHKYITMRIKPDVTFQKFSRRKNKGYKNDREVSEIKQQTNKNVVNDTAKELGCLVNIADFDNKTSEFEDFLLFRYGDYLFNQAKTKVLRRYSNG